MKRIALALAAFLAITFSALAQDPAADHSQAIAAMQAQCVAVMDQGLCRVALDRSVYPGPTVMLSGVGRVSTDAYLRVQGTGFAKDANGRWVMCQIIPTFCADWNSQECLAIRGNWRQTAP